MFYYILDIYCCYKLDHGQLKYQYHYMNTNKMWYRWSNL